MKKDVNDVYGLYYHEDGERVDERVDEIVDTNDIKTAQKLKY